MTTAKTKSSWKISEFVAHASNINCVVLSPSNGRLLATGGDDRKINLWSPGKPNNILSISGITSPVQSVAFNNSENWIGAGSKSGVIKVFDLEEKKTVRTISGHKSLVSSLDFHRFGEILATGSSDTNLKIWDVKRKGCIFTYKGHTDTIEDVQFSPDGKWVASASADNTVKIWDLSAGRMVADFRAHSGPVTCIRFHPKEFLMVSGSGDRTAKFWDLEKFEVVSEISPESNGIRRILFHQDGSVLFTGTQESLRVHGWEPAVTHDVFPLRWGKLADMAISGEQLIAASYSQTNVSVWCVELKALQPFSPEQPTSQHPLTASGRRRFEFNEMPHERPPTQSSEQVGNGEVGGEGGGDSPPTQVKDEERKQLFMQCQKLVRTPPKEIHRPFRPPDSPPHAQRDSHPREAIHPSHHVPAQPSAPDVTKVGDRLSHEEHPRRDFQPPKPVVMGKSPESRVIGEVVTNHADVGQMLNSRLAVLRSTREAWSSSDPKTALEMVINSGNQSALVDMLNHLHLKRTLWTLDMATIVLPELKLLLKNKYSMYVVCGCKIIKLILKSFGPVIKANISLPPSSGVDISREERYEKCHTCHSHLISLQEDVHRLQTDPKLGRLIREQGMVGAFSVLV